MKNKFLQVFKDIYEFQRMDIGPLVVQEEEDELEQEVFKWPWQKKKEKPSIEIITGGAARRETLVSAVRSAWELFPVDNHGAPLPITFDFIWDFCEFVHCADKIVFYPNIATNKLFVNDDINRYNDKEYSRSFIIKEKDYYTITVEAKKVPEPVGVDLFLNSIQITTERKYGVASERTDVFIDEVSAHNKEDDPVFEMYVTTLSDLIYEECLAIYKDIINKLTSKHGIEMK